MEQEYRGESAEKSEMGRLAIPRGLKLRLKQKDSFRSFMQNDIAGQLRNSDCV